MDNDKSKEEIMRRYRAGNELAIVTFSRICFESIQDVLYLLKEQEKAQERIKELEQEVLSLKGELGR